MKTILIPFLAILTIAATFAAQTVVPPDTESKVVLSPGSGQTLIVTDSKGKVFDPDGSITVTFTEAPQPSPTPTPTPSPSPSPSPSPTPSPSPSPSPSPTPSGPGVAVACPLPNQTISSPVAVVAHATANPGHHIDAIRLYVDGIESLTVKPGADINKNVDMPSGPRILDFVAWDETGAFYKTEINITVK